MKIRHIINEMGSRMPSSMVKTKSKLDSMNPDEIRAFFKNREDFAKQHAGGVIRPGFSAKELAQRQEFSYGREFAKGRPYSKHFESTELDEGLKDWLQKMAVAGIIVGSVAGIGSINNAINNNVPVIQAMNKALDVANQKGDKQLIQNIKQDIEVARLSLDSGKDLNTVKQMQDRYAKFMPADYKPSTPAPKFKEAEEVSKTDTLTIDIPMFIRLMEYAREDAKTDMDLHNVTTNLLKIKDKIISMADYNQVVVSSDVDAADAADESFKDKVIKKIAQPVKDYNKNKEQPKKS
jgi:hypothetical protein